MHSSHLQNFFHPYNYTIMSNVGLLETAEVAASRDEDGNTQTPTERETAQPNPHEPLEMEETDKTEKMAEETVITAEDKANHVQSHQPEIDKISDVTHEILHEYTVSCSSFTNETKSDKSPDQLTQEAVILQNQIKNSSQNQSLEAGAAPDVMKEGSAKLKNDTENSPSFEVFDQPAINESKGDKTSGPLIREKMPQTDKVVALMQSNLPEAKTNSYEISKKFSQVDRFSVDSESEAVCKLSLMVPVSPVIKGPSKNQEPQEKVPLAVESTKDKQKPSLERKEWSKEKPEDLSHIDRPLVMIDNGVGCGESSPVSDESVTCASREADKPGQVLEGNMILSSENTGSKGLDRSKVPGDSPKFTVSMGNTVHSNPPLAVCEEVVKNVALEKVVENPDISVYKSKEDSLTNPDNKCLGKGSTKTPLGCDKDSVYRYAIKTTNSTTLILTPDQWDELQSHLHDSSSGKKESETCPSFQTKTHQTRDDMGISGSVSSEASLTMQKDKMREQFLNVTSEVSTTRVATSDHQPEIKLCTGFSKASCTELPSSHPSSKSIMSSTVLRPLKSERRQNELSKHQSSELVNPRTTTVSRQESPQSKSSRKSSATPLLVKLPFQKSKTVISTPNSVITTSVSTVSEASKIPPTTSTGTAVPHKATAGTLKLLQNLISSPAYKHIVHKASGKSSSVSVVLSNESFAKETAKPSSFEMVRATSKQPQGLLQSRHNQLNILSHSQNTSNSSATLSFVNKTNSAVESNLLSIPTIVPADISAEDSSINAPVLRVSTPATTTVADKLASSGVKFRQQNQLILPADSKLSTTGQYILMPTQMSSGTKSGSRTTVTSVVPKPIIMATSSTSASCNSLMDTQLKCATTVNTPTPNSMPWPLVNATSAGSVVILGGTTLAKSISSNTNSTTPLILNLGGTSVAVYPVEGSATSASSTTNTVTTKILTSPSPQSQLSTLSTSSKLSSDFSDDIHVGLTKGAQSKLSAYSQLKTLLSTQAHLHDMLNTKLVLSRSSEDKSQPNPNKSESSYQGVRTIGGSLLASSLTSSHEGHQPQSPAKLAKTVKVTMPPYHKEMFHQSMIVQPSLSGPAQPVKIMIGQAHTSDHSGVTDRLLCGKDSVPVTMANAQPNARSIHFKVGAVASSKKANLGTVSLLRTGSAVLSSAHCSSTDNLSTSLTRQIPHTVLAKSTLAQVNPSIARLQPEATKVPGPSVVKESTSQYMQTSSQITESMKISTSPYGSDSSPATTLGRKRHHPSENQLTRAADMALLSTNRGKGKHAGGRKAKKAKSSVISATVNTGGGPVKVMVLAPPPDGDSSDEGPDEQTGPQGSDEDTEDMDIDIDDGYSEEQDMSVLKQLLRKTSQPTERCTMVNQTSTVSQFATEEFSRSEVFEGSKNLPAYKTELTEKGIRFSQLSNAVDGAGQVSESVQLPGQTTNADHETIYDTDEPEDDGCLGLKITSVFSLQNGADLENPEAQQDIEFTYASHEAEEKQETLFNIPDVVSKKNKPSLITTHKAKKKPRTSCNVLSEAEKTPKVSVDVPPKAEEKLEMPFDDLPEVENKPETSFNVRESCDWQQSVSSCFVVLERLTKSDITTAEDHAGLHLRCSDYCRKRTLNYLCELNLLTCVNHPDPYYFLKPPRPGSSRPRPRKVARRKVPKEVHDVKNVNGHMPPQNFPSPAIVQETMKPGTSNALSLPLCLPNSCKEKMPDSATLKKSATEDINKKQLSNASKQDTKVSLSLNVANKSPEKFEDALRQLQLQVERKRKEMNKDKLARTRKRRVRKSKYATSSSTQLNTQLKTKDKVARKMKGQPRNRKCAKVGRTNQGTQVMSKDKLVCKTKQQSKINKQYKNRYTKVSSQLSQEFLRHVANVYKYQSNFRDKIEQMRQFQTLKSLDANSDISAQVTNSSPSAKKQVTGPIKNFKISKAGGSTTIPAGSHSTSIPAGSQPSQLPGLPTEKVKLALKSLVSFLSATGRKVTEGNSQYFLLKIENQLVLVKVPPTADLTKNVDKLKIVSTKSVESPSFTNSAEGTPLQIQKNIQLKEPVISTCSSTSAKSTDISSGLVQTPSCCTSTSVSTQPSTSSLATPLHPHVPAVSAYPQMVSLLTPSALPQSSQSTTQVRQGTPTNAVSVGGLATSHQMVRGMAPTSVSSSGNIGGKKRVYDDSRSVLSHLPPNSTMLPQRQNMACTLTDAEKRAKRRKLEAKYPLPPGIVIKSEPDDSEYEQSGSLTVTSNVSDNFTTAPQSTTSPVLCRLGQVWSVMADTGESSAGLGEKESQGLNKRSSGLVSGSQIKLSLEECQEGHEASDLSDPTQELEQLMFNSQMNENDAVEEADEPPTLIDEASKSDSVTEGMCDSESTDTGDELPPVLQPMFTARSTVSPTDYADFMCAEGSISTDTSVGKQNTFVTHICHPPTSVTDTIKTGESRTSESATSLLSERSFCSLDSGIDTVSPSTSSSATSLAHPRQEVKGMATVAPKNAKIQHLKELLKRKEMEIENMKRMQSSLPSLDLDFEND